MKTTFTVSFEFRDNKLFCVIENKGRCSTIQSELIDRSNDDIRRKGLQSVLDGLTNHLRRVAFPEDAPVFGVEQTVQTLLKLFTRDFQMSVFKLKNPQKGVPGGCNFFVHQTNYTVYADVLSTLKLKVGEHMSANGIPIPENLSEVIEDQICRRLQDQGSGSVCRDISEEERHAKLVQVKTSCCGR